MWLGATLGGGRTDCGPWWICLGAKDGRWGRPVREGPALAEPGPQPGGDAARTHPWIVGAEGAVTLQDGPEGRPGFDLAEIDGQAQLREPVREPDPESAIGRGIAVRHVAIRADERSRL